MKLCVALFLSAAVDRVGEHRFYSLDPPGVNETRLIRCHDAVVHRRIGQP
jgi:hypothetical protein